MKKQIFVFIFSILVLNVHALERTNAKITDIKTITVQGTFDGYDSDSGYSFIITDESDGSDEYIFFEAITEDALQSVNLQSEAFVGKRFEVTYEVTEYTEEDENGNPETFEKFTIVKVKPL
jgi:cold shock CspA family protein